MFISPCSLAFKRANFAVIKRLLILSPYYHCDRGRCYCDQNDNDKVGKSKNESKVNEEEPIETIQPGLESKYIVFKDADAPILLDVYEEKLQGNIELEETVEEFHELSLQRGIKGVFDIDDLIELLRRDKAKDIFVAELPPEARYVDYIVIVTGKSRKHMTALAEIVRRMFKKKRNSTDVVPRIEGEGSSIWMAIDLGNIALHIFSEHARRVYDLETLWSVGTEYDSLSNAAEDPLIALLKKHSISLNGVTSKGQLL